MSIGHGAFAEVYLVVDICDKEGKPYAMKVLRGDKIHRRLLFRKKSGLIEQ